MAERTWEWVSPMTYLAPSPPAEDIQRPQFELSHGLPFVVWGLLLVSFNREAQIGLS
jgi:hypothetical protein